MTKAKEALDSVNKYGVMLSSETTQTIRKALELLDKVERGETIKAKEAFSEFNRMRLSDFWSGVDKKYILIERE